MDKALQLRDIFETGMINNVFYADKFDAVYQAFCYFGENNIQEKDVIKAYRNPKNENMINIPRIIGLWLLEKRGVFSRYFRNEITTFEEMLIFCIPIYHPNLIIIINSAREEIISEWFVDHLNSAYSIKYFNELKNIFSELQFEYKSKYPDYINALRNSFLNESAEMNFMYHLAQGIQERILNKGYMEYSDLVEIRENGVPYNWLSELFTKLDETNLELLVTACVGTFDEPMVTEYMKYFYKTENEEMIRLLLERSYEIKEKDVTAFSNVKKYEMDFMFFDVVIDVSPQSKEVVEKFEYLGSHITRFPSEQMYLTVNNPFCQLKKTGKWLLVTHGHPAIEIVEEMASEDYESELIVWVIDNPHYVPKYENVTYIIGANMASIIQIKRIMGLKV